MQRHYLFTCSLVVIALAACSATLAPVGQRQPTPVPQAAIAPTSAPVAVQSTTPMPAPPDPHPVALINELRKGGYLIYMRHGKTDFSQRDITSDYDDCSGQRNLTEAGRAELKAAGVALAALRIPIGKVMASPYCRTRETATLVFGKFERAAHYDVIKAQAEEALGTPVAPGSNTVVVAHGFILRDAARIILMEGEMAIFKPRSKTEQGAVARISPADWQAWAAGSAQAPSPALQTITEFDLPEGKYVHDVAPATDGSVWWTAQTTGELGRLDPATGKSTFVALGTGSRPHGVITGPDGAAWITDGGRNAIIRVDAATSAVREYPLPAGKPNANLNTAVFDKAGQLWFTGQSGVYGRLNVQSGNMDVWDAPRGSGPYGIAAAPDGTVYFASLAGNYLGQVDPRTGQVTVLEPPTPAQGARRVWVDSKNRAWISEWNVGKIGMYDPASKTWKEWDVPGAKRAQPYAIYVDAKDGIWITDFANNAIVNYSPGPETFVSYPHPSPGGNVRQLLGRPFGTWREIWGGESGARKLILIRAE